MDYRGTENGIDCPAKNILQSILIVEDHKLSGMGYQLIVEQASFIGNTPQFNIQQAHSLKEAYQNLARQGIRYDIVFLDICMESYPEQNLFSGEDLGRFIVEKYTETKVLVMTSLTDTFRLKGILHTLKPHGFLIKNEVDEHHLVKAIQNILNDQFYFSSTIAKIAHNQTKTNILVDEEDRRFLYLLSKGIPNKEIGNYLPWSLSKVEKRKRAIHKKLGVEKGNTIVLVNKAKELGII